MNDRSNWEKRKEAAETLMTMLEEAEGKINFGNSSELLNTLKTRINDPNKQLIKVFVHLTGLVVPLLSDR